MQGDRWQRVDRVAFRIRDLGAMKAFSEGLAAILRGNHRQQEDFRIDDVAARMRKRQSQGDVYNMIFMLSGVLSLIGGGMVNVNIQMATLKERVREVGVKMAIGASGREVFKEFMTEALLLTGLGALVGFAAGVAFSKVITSFLEIKLFMQPSELPVGVRACGRSSASSSRCIRRGRRAGCLRWRRCAMSSASATPPNRNPRLLLRPRTPFRVPTRAGACPGARDSTSSTRSSPAGSSSSGRTSCARSSR